MISHFFELQQIVQPALRNDDALRRFREYSATCRPLPAFSGLEILKPSGKPCRAAYPAAL